MSDELLELALACEAADAGDADLDHAIGAAMHKLGWHAADCIANFTRSLDASATLVLEGYGFMVDGAGTTWFADLDAAEDMQGEARSPALALTAASLRARASRLRMEVE